MHSGFQVRRGQHLPLLRLSAAAAGYLAYPFKVSSNILNSFASDDIAIQVKHEPGLTYLAPRHGCTPWLVLHSIAGLPVMLRFSACCSKRAVMESCLHTCVAPTCFNFCRRESCCSRRAFCPHEPLVQFFRQYWCGSAGNTCTQTHTCTHRCFAPSNLGRSLAGLCAGCSRCDWLCGDRALPIEPPPSKERLGGELSC